MAAPPILLLIEDDEARIERIQSWLPSDIRLVVARSAGRAIGTLRMDGPETYAGIMLDHDLHQQTAAAADEALSGTNLIDVIIRQAHREAPILVHSMNSVRARAMVERLTRAGFWTIRVPFFLLTQKGLVNWIDDVRDLWSDRL